MENPIFKFPLGSTLVDQVSGFHGIVTGRANYLTGCNQYSLQPKAHEGRLPDNVWLDEVRLVAAGDYLVKLKSDDEKGGPQNHPNKR